MKRKFITCIYLVLFFICAKQLFTYMYNENLISKYNKQVYHTSTAPLFVLNFFEPYIAHYNAGNIYYQNGEYSNAIIEYQKALEKKTPKFKECSIRINLALSMIGLIGEDYDAPENIDATIIAQAPKMRPHIDAMRANLAEDLDANLDQVNVKATRGEKLGFIGREEGIAAECVVLLFKKEMK